MVKVPFVPFFPRVRQAWWRWALGVATLLLLVLTTMLVPAGCALLRVPKPNTVTTAQRLEEFRALPPPPFERPVTIHWNERAVPYIIAQTDHDAAFALGLVQAHLRLGQLEMGKRLAQARLAEMFGPPVLRIDQGLRTLGFTRAVPEMLARMPGESRAWLDAFVAGVNFYKRNLKRLPPEFAVLNLKNEPWTAEDSLALGRVAGIDVNWLSFFSLLPHRADPAWPEVWEKKRELDGQALPSIATLPPEQSALLSGTLAWLGAYSRSGSNSVVIAANRSASGAPLIANDPHLGTGLPNLWLMGGVQSPSMHAVGMLVPGVPVFAFGRTPHLAWGGTNIHSWSSDLVDITTATGAITGEERHRFARRFWFGSHLTTRTSKYGPVLSDAGVLPNPQEKTLALRWTGHLPSDEITAMLGAARARDGAELREALGTFAVPGQNICYATRTGAIGFLMAVWLPGRPDAFPRDVYATPGESDEAWQRILTSRELPWIENPAAGYIASGNNKSYDAGPTRAGMFYGSDQRVRRVREMMRAREQWSVEDLRALQRDTRSVMAARVRDALLTATQGVTLGSEALALRDTLAAWDARYDTDSRGALVYEGLRAALEPEIFSAAGEAERLPIWKAFGLHEQRMLELLPRLDAATRGRLFEAACAAVRPALAADRRWGDAHRLRVQHLVGNAPVIGGRFRLGSFPYAGSMETLLKAAHPRTAEPHIVYYGSQSRHISDMADPDANHFVLLGGQDGWLGSANFADQVPLWLAGEYVQLPLGERKVAELFTTKHEFAARVR